MDGLKGSEKNGGRLVYGLKTEIFLNGNASTIYAENFQDCVLIAVEADYSHSGVVVRILERFSTQVSLLRGYEQP